MNLLEKRSALFAEQEGIIEKAKGEVRGFNADEKSRYDEITKEIAGLDELIAAEERSAAMRAPKTPAIKMPVGEGRADEKKDEEYRSSFLSHLRGENIEKRGLTVGTHGTVLLPNTLYSSIVEGLEMYGGVRSASVTVLPNAAGTVRITMGNDTVKGHRVNASAATTVDPTSLATKALTVYDYTSDVITVDRTLLSGSPLEVERYLAGLLTVRIARIFNDEATTGTGSGMPEGVLTAATLGFTGASATAVSYADLVETEHSVPAQFRIRAQWMMNDKTFKFIKKLVDANGLPLWARNIEIGAPATLLGYEVIINDSLPDLGTGLKPIMFGDFSRYFVADGPNMSVEVFNEMYKANNQVGFVLFSSHGGALGDAAGAVRYFKNA